ncbi:hypothetical protein SUGI_0841850 [Cryptomeria japonica]|nr:hypothetical protein SUGI_0841850 [Cryptomeria japonica]
MLINVGGLWDTPIPVADEMPCLPSLYTDIISTEAFPSYNIEAYQSLEDCTYLKSFSAGQNLESNLEYGVRAIDFIEDQPKDSSVETMDSQYALTHGVFNESKRKKRAVGIEMSENILCAHTSKALRVRSSAAKDRHCKVSTVKGLRDTRVRLSHSIAVKFFDLQDRLGYAHPSKALDWLISKAQAAIDELPQPSYVSQSNCTVCNSLSRSGSTSLPTDQIPKMLLSLFHQHHLQQECQYLKPHIMARHDASNKNDSSVALACTTQRLKAKRIPGMDF